VIRQTIQRWQALLIPTDKRDRELPRPGHEAGFAAPLSSPWTTHRHNSQLLIGAYFGHIVRHTSTSHFKDHPS
jgi:hypothetical protein